MAADHLVDCCGRAALETRSWRALERPLARVDIRDESLASHGAHRRLRRGRDAHRRVPRRAGRLPSRNSVEGVGRRASVAAVAGPLAKPLPQGLPRGGGRPPAADRPRRAGRGPARARRLSQLRDLWRGRGHRDRMRVDGRRTGAGARRGPPPAPVPPAPGRSLRPAPDRGGSSREHVFARAALRRHRALGNARRVWTRLGHARARAASSFPRVPPSVTTPAPRNSNTSPSGSRRTRVFLCGLAKAASFPLVM